MKQRDVSRRQPRRDKLIDERVHDPYKMRRKLPEPTVCPQCHAVWRNGRWQWGPEPSPAHAALCHACQRINDHYPAGEVTVSGGFLAAHRDEIVALVRHLEEAQKEEHAGDRIMAIADAEDGLRITTTDIHLPRRIGHALHDAYKGDLDVHYDEKGYFLRVAWRREA